ncbi:MAG: DNA repair protein RecO [Pseudomonadota bacterium]
MRYDDLHSLVLHVRPYRETSAIIQFFTREQGLLRAVMRGVRGGRKSSPVQAFACGSLSCYGRGDLLTVTRFEARNAIILHGNLLSAGFYVLEITSRLLQTQQAEPEIFDITMDVLFALQRNGEVVAALRPYETRLLELLGYGVDYLHDARSGDAVQPEHTYRFEAETGFILCDPANTADSRQSAASSGSACFSGAVLRAIQAGDLSTPKVRQAAGLINRQCLAPLLGSKPLVSRQLWASPGDTPSA